MPLWLAIAVTVGIATAVVLHRRPAGAARSLRAITAVALVASLAAGVAHALERRAGRPSISEQQASIARAAHDEHRRIVLRAAVSLHGARAGRSQVLVLRDDRTPEPSSSDAATDGRRRLIVPRPDELRIYDILDGRLREAFRFAAPGAGPIWHVPGTDRLRFHLIVDRPADIDGDGRPEVVATFERVSQATGRLTVPMLVAWDDAARRYRLSPLTVEPPRLQTRRTGSRAALEANGTPIVTVDRAGSRHVKAFAVDTYRIVRSHPYPVLLGGYRDGDALLSGREQYELDVWTKHLQDGTVDSMACFRSPVAVSGRAGNDIADALIRWVARHGPPACER